MKNLTIIFVLWLLFLANAFCGLNIYVDGEYHLIETATYEDYCLDRTWSGQDIWNDPGTRLVVTTGGVVGSISANALSSVLISGGSTGEIRPFGRSTVEILSGSVHNVWSATSSIVHIKGGHVGTLQTESNQPMYLYGSTFKVNGIDLHFGDNLSSYGLSNHPLHDTYDGNWVINSITGVLQDGSALDTTFLIYESRSGGIIIIPEPCTLLLLGLGGLLIRKR